MQKNDLPNDNIRAGDQSWQALLAGNQRFLTGNPMHHDMLQALKDYDHQHAPKAILLCCMDARVAPEIIFDQDLGQLFVIRNAGNVQDDDVLASMEYAAAVIKTPLIVVMGHTDCGAVKATCQHVEFGHLLGLTKAIEPAVNTAMAKTKLTDINDLALVNASAKENVLLQIKRIKDESPILNKLAEDGKLSIRGAMFDITTGEVSAL